jgi:hypothetical protein
VGHEDDCEDMCMSSAVCVAFQYIDAPLEGSGGFGLVGSGACYFYSGELFTSVDPVSDTHCYIKEPSGGAACETRAPTKSPSLLYYAPSAAPTGWDGIDRP